MSTFFVVRHIPTQTLLPARVLATRWEFDCPPNVYEPRLFKTARAAKNCATCWAQGRWEQELMTESEGWEYPSYNYLAEPVPNAVPGRKREDLEVVKCELNLLSSASTSSAAAGT